MSCFLSDYDQLIGFKATLLFPSLSLSCELVLRPGVSSSEFLGENEESGRVKHISTDTDTCPMWDHPTHDPLPPHHPHSSLLLSFSAVLSPSLLNEFPSSFPLNSSSHTPSTHSHKLQHSFSQLFLSLFKMTEIVKP